VKIYLNCNDNEVTFNKKNYLLRAAERMGLSHIFKESGKDDGAPEEYILNIEPCDIRMGHKWTGLWHIDVLLNSPLSSQYGGVDTAWVSSDQGIIKHDQVLFQAMDTEIHKRYSKPNFDFILCGSMGGVHSKREEASVPLKKKFTYHDFGKDIKAPEYIKVYSEAKVQWIRTGENDQGKGAVAQRFFECLGIGPVLTNYTPDLELLGLVDGQDYVSYKGDKDMLEKMGELIKDSDLRDKIAYNGRMKALMYHTYEHRLVAILNTVNENIPSST